MALDKARLRQRYLAMRQGLSTEERQAADEEIRRYLCQLLRRVLPEIAGFASLDRGSSGESGLPLRNSGIPEGLALPPLTLAPGEGRRVVTLYRAMRGEVDIFPVIACIEATGGRVAFPVTRMQERRLDFYEFTADTRWQCSSFGIAEPQPDSGQGTVPEAALAVVVVPGLAFTRQGVRLGYGGGFYDRLLASSQVTALRVGVGYSTQWAQSLPTQSHDQLLHLIITERGVWNCLQPPSSSPEEPAGAWEGTS